MLTAALNADPVKSGQAYDVPAISQGLLKSWKDIQNWNVVFFYKVLDLLHIMDYDYHGGWEEFTGKTS